MVEIRQARYFVAVAEELHFGRAAQRLRMSQPPLSQAIKQLEQRLGCELLHRTQRSVALNAAGAVFLDHCRTLIRQAEEAEIATRQAATGRGGRLSLGAVASAFSWPLPLVLERFHEALPDVEIRTQEIDTHEAGPGLLDRSLDWAIVRQTAPVRGTATTSLYADRFVAALPSRHPAADTTGPLDLADLADAPWVWLHRHISPDYHDAMATMCRAAGFSPAPAHWARSVTSQIAMVECGLGVTVVPAAASASHPAVRFRPLRHTTATIELTAMTRSAPGALAERLTAIATRLTTAEAPPPHD
ncbi:LysR substrate-binding domain-containing protein [Streptomyces europaeiscabiei]|uniref:LysR substrate-binding domain-containing protein n=1 Tax=Streptomyces TaxID=1883 RepID=UPI000A3D17C3|nr:MULTISPECIES: LysR substrate-binding domain-containing protein [Streptomyces]MDX3582434.1 LysR substrate-binding domain-containing protein [Streptomyces europaeiscabiei]MDX3611355.1 LysR substrate-binding domain-containing protein [Streptomyces europaeiscabiei]MDX3630501.1 LysR substrate-binding domain-containing protein [Streptomyces europaeiscabiei]MDX3648638.1 LysR substrate-binding domain-containing protein [Streptomyces europaeiscabiei]WUD30847.1 LysR substrate-binding domain-containin